MRKKMSNLKLRSKREERRGREVELRRNDVLAAAAAVFAEKGFQGAQVAEIANEAELSLNAVYSLFKGKEELYEAVVHAAVATIRDRVQAQVESCTDPGEKLLAVIDALFECFGEYEHLLKIYARATHGLPWRVRQALGPESADVMHDFTSWLQRLAVDAKQKGRIGGLDPEALSLALIGAVTTTAARWVESASERPLAEAAPRVRELFEVLLTEADA